MYVKITAINCFRNITVKVTKPRNLIIGFFYFSKKNKNFLK